MKKLILTLAVSCFALAAANAGEKNETTVTGDVKCAHCDLSVATSCQKAIQTADSKIILLEGKKVDKFFEENKKAAKVTATGLTTKEGENTVLKASKIELAEG